ncbi:peptidyl-prolyl cis-trans isomerase G-like [Stegodyphus dumicola]|uniref:peptidyl-prolyl cis-trans isomerase G-like n=1 Tax=Stegodyphus dumicola TaxID=202533 RepID=UPI0015A9F56D|nr:peptidyl-prolyl cis-trans isomerase G-like [Stegodyphus dumicola]XP_035216865.1 peptidyl-prolyl cis-trans isomerase G-like [Stegodyphus dumicola]XP_035216866.1 peptidyl-prolyl cis-trans isomerase G-like [Stegodyphus dumicola]
MTVDDLRPRCFLDIEINSVKAGRIVVELYSDICPITCENFRALCTGEKGLGKTTNKPLHYKGSPFHRVVKNFVIQGGDFVAGNGTSGESIYGGQFKDENFELPHDKPFLLSMSNRGKDSNGSQFFITTQPAPHLNGKHTVFGHVISGQDVISQIEEINTDQNCRPTKDVRIANCGELVLKLKPKDKKKKKELASESSESDYDSEDERERSKKKKKHKHSKKHKKDKKDVKNYNSNMEKNTSDLGCMVDPDEIPTIPVNNFLMRRTSPIADNTRRDSRIRETFNFQRRPSRSRSGRKIKGRGCMRYRTPSPSGSRSGSETPPHWKQAQSRLRNIKDVLPKKEVTPSDEESEEPEDGTSRSTYLQSRLGTVKANDDPKPKDARLSIQENRRIRAVSPESPKRNLRDADARGRQFRQALNDLHASRKLHNTSPVRGDKHHSSPIRSKIVVKGSISKDVEERLNERDSYRRVSDRRSRRDSTPERKSYSNYLESNSRKRKLSDSHSLQRKEEKDVRKHKPEPKSEKESLKQKKRFKELEADLFRYQKQKYDYESDEDDTQPQINIDKHLDTPNNSEIVNDVPEQKSEKEILKQKKIFNALEADLLRYQKHKYNNESDKSDDTEPQVSVEKSVNSQNVNCEIIHDVPRNKKDASSHILNEKSGETKENNNLVSQEIINGNECNLKFVFFSPKSPSPTYATTYLSKSKSVAENSQFDLAESEERKSVERTTELTNSLCPQNMESLSSTNDNNKAEEGTMSEEKPFENNISSVSHESSSQSVIPSKSNEEKGEIQKYETFKVNQLDTVLNETNSESPLIQKATETTKNIAEPVPTVFHPSPFEYRLPDIIPLPEESKFQAEISNAATDTSAEKTENMTAEVFDSESSRHFSSEKNLKKNKSPVHEDVSKEDATALKLPAPTSEYSSSPERNETSSAALEIVEKKASTPLRQSSSRRTKSRSPRNKSTSSQSRKRSSRSSSKSSGIHSTKKKRMSKSPERREGASRRTRSSTERKSKSPSHRTRSVSRRRRSSALCRSKSRSRSKSGRRSSSPRSRTRRRYSRSPDVRARRSRSRNWNDRGSRFYRYSGMRNRSPDRRGSYTRRYTKSPSYRGRARGRSAPRHSRSRSRSLARRRRRTRHSSSSSASSSSRNSSSSGSEGAKKRGARRGIKGRSKRSSSSSSSSRSKRSNSRSDSAST